MSISEVILSAIFGVWFILTAMIQIPRPWAKWPRKFDPTGHLLPGWNFFAPKPIMADIEVRYRFASWHGSEQEISRWRNVQPTGKRRFRHVIINPYRRPSKAIFQAAHRLLLAQGRRKKNKPDFELSVPYLLLLDRVTSLCSGAVAVQFRIDVVRPGRSGPLTGFQSPMHAVGAESGEFVQVEQEQVGEQVEEAEVC
jgi:hypothetical protein